MQQAANNRQRSARDVITHSVSRSRPQCPRSPHRSVCSSRTLADACARGPCQQTAQRHVLCHEGQGPEMSHVSTSGTQRHCGARDSAAKSSTARLLIPTPPPAVAGREAPAAEEYHQQQHQADALSNERAQDRYKSTRVYGCFALCRQSCCVRVIKGS